MNFTINNTSEVKNLANELINNGANINSIVQELTAILTTFSTAWEESQSDAQAFRRQLQNEIDYATRTTSVNNEFANSLISYINFIEKTGSTSASTNGSI